jgi:hypothetical protein
MQPLLRTRPIGVQILLAGLVPAVFGAVCGWLLGVNKIAYLVGAVGIAVVGGYLAGLEHDGAGEGALRGLVGGAIFGGCILAIHEATGKAPKVKLPHPAIGLLIFTVVGGVILGALGGSARHRREEAGPREGPAIDLKQLKWPEYLGFAGAAVLLGSLFLPWFSTSCSSLNPPKPGGCNPHSMLEGRVGDYTAFQTYKIMDILLVAACIAPFVLAYILARSHELTWAPGEVTMIVGMIAGALILLNGIILGRPGGSSSVDIAIEPGYVVGLIGANMILAGGLIRQARYSRARKPPGVL